MKNNFLDHFLKKIIKKVIKKILIRCCHSFAVILTLTLPIEASTKTTQGKKITRHIDRPYTLQKGTLSLNLNLTLQLLPFASNSGTSNSDPLMAGPYAFSIDTPLTDNFTFEWSPLPLMLRYQIYHGDETTLGLRLGVGYDTSALIYGECCVSAPIGEPLPEIRTSLLVPQPQFRIYYRYREPSWALELELRGLIDAADYNGNSERFWYTEILAQTRFQPNDLVSLALNIRPQLRQGIETFNGNTSFSSTDFGVVLGAEVTAIAFESTEWRLAWSFHQLTDKVTPHEVVLGMIYHW